jgi:hypothetical protein
MFISDLTVLDYCERIKMFHHCIVSYNHLLLLLLLSNSLKKKDEITKYSLIS